MTEDPKTCLRHEAEGRYCWPGDGEQICANCRQIVNNRAKELGDLIDRKICDQINREILKRFG